MDVLASFFSPLGPSLDTPTVKRSSQPPTRLLAAAAGTILLLLPALALADAAPPQVSGRDGGRLQTPGAVELTGPPVAALPPKKGQPPVAQPRDARAALSPEERALRGVVTIERAGQPLGLGAVLMGDGRILTALSPLGPGNDLDARFADGSTARVKLGHHDRAWDLALLVPADGPLAGRRSPPPRASRSGRTRPSARSP